MPSKRDVALIPCLLTAGMVLAACSEPECPDGFNKVSKSCLRADGGATDGSVDPAEVAPPDDASAGSNPADATQSIATDAAAALTLDGEASSDGSPSTSAEGSVAVGDNGMENVDAGSGASRDAGAPAVDTGVDAQLGDTGAVSNVCEPNPCQNGGTCSAGAQGAICNCGSSGFTGTRCEADIDECAQANVCSNPAYPCAQTEPPGYTCRGHFADWPMPDKTVWGVAPSYDTTTLSGVTIDKVTGLDWVRQPPSTYPRCTGKLSLTGDTCTWDEAQDYCDKLILAGLDDWRLPSKIEYESIVEMTPPPVKTTDPFLDPSTHIRFWTASPYADSDNSWWTVSSNGGQLTFPRAEVHRVRCVRTRRRPVSGTPMARYTVNAGGTVRDNRTGLLWQRALAPGSVTATEADANCAARGQGWRLPTVKELLTVVDPTVKYPAAPVHMQVFPDTAASALWSNHQISDGTVTARYVLMLTQGVAGGYSPGHIFGFEETKPLLARCVRGN